VFVLIVGLSTFLEPVAPGQNATAIRSSSSLVLVPVSALDKSGNFVADLSAHDFQIFVDGQAVEVASFDAVREVSPPSARNPGRLAALPPQYLSKHLRILREPAEPGHSFRGLFEHAPG
jgi:hypothetical protein